MKTYYVNAFTGNNLLGNPAGILVLKEWLADEELQAIALDTGLPATAFIVKKDKTFYLRTFATEYELEICGHATLAAASVVFNEIDSMLEQIDFHTPFATIKVQKTNELIYLDFPSRNIEACDPRKLLTDGLGLKPQATYHYNHERCLAVFESEEEVRSLKPNMELLKQLEYRGVDVTAPGKDVDIVCRTFYAKLALNKEDPVCGSAHCILAPYWAKRLNKTQIHSHQVSDRGGELFCTLKSDRVLIGGKADIYSEKT